MRCPVCEIGTVVRIYFKRNKKLARLCDCCEALWEEGEDIGGNTNHTLHSYAHGDEYEYLVDDLEDNDYEHQPARYLEFR